MFIFNSYENLCILLVQVFIMVKMYMVSCVVTSFPADVFVGILNLYGSIPGLSILTKHIHLRSLFYENTPIRLNFILWNLKTV